MGMARRLARPVRRLARWRRRSLADDLGKRYGRFRRSTGSTSRSQPASSSGCSGRTAPGSRRSSRSPAGSIRAVARRAEICGAPAGSPAAPRRARLPRRALPLPRLVLAPTRCSRCTSGWPARTAASASGASCSSWSASPTRATVASTRCRRGCSSGSGIAQALVGAPRLLLLDEPTSALDPAGRRDRARAARGAARTRDRRPPQLAPPQRGRARLRPRRHPLARPVVGGRDAGRALAAARRRDRDRRRRAARSRTPAREDAPRLVAELVARPASRSTACAWSRRASRRRTSRPSVARRMRAVARSSPRTRSQEALRRRVFVVVLAAHARLPRAVLARRRTRRSRRSTELERLAGCRSTSRTITGGDAASGSRCSGRSSSAPCSPSFLTLGAVRGDAERGLLQPLVVGPLGRRALLVGRFLGAAAVCASTSSSSTPLRAAHAAGGRLVARRIRAAGARARRRGRSSSRRSRCSARSCCRRRRTGSRSSWSSAPGSSRACSGRSARR